MKRSTTFLEPPLGRRAVLASVFGAAVAAALAKSSAASATGRRRASPDVYLFRGFGNVFSTGLDDIGSRLSMAGIDTHVEPFTAEGWAFDKIVADRRVGATRPIALIGHSLGANAIVGLAEKLDTRGITVDYMASFAATGPDSLPGNIRFAQNFYFATNGWGRPLVPGPKFRGRIDNRDFSNQPGIGHFNIDKLRRLQDEVVKNVLRLAV